MGEIFMKIKLMLSLILMLLLMNVTIFAAVESYPVISWSTDDMEVGNTTGLTINNNTLTFVNPITDEESVKVVNAIRTIGDKVYTKAIKTNGGTNQFVNGIPNHRALSFEVTKPCDLIVYSYGASSDYTINLCVSKKALGSNQGVEIYNETVEHSKIKRYSIYLDEPGTYYIYGRGGSISFCEIQRGCVKGDLDRDFNLDWNDIRIAKRVFNNKISNTDEYEYKMNLLNTVSNNNGSNVTIDDLNEQRRLLSDAELKKAEFVSNKAWNVSSMPLGRYETYDGLELVSKDLDLNSMSIEVYNMNRTYIGNNGETKKFTKVIATDGYLSEAMDDYCVTKAVKFNLEEDALVTLYMSTGSSENVEHRAVIYDADKNVVANFPLTTNIGKYTIELDGNQTYFVGSHTGTIRIFEIDCNAAVSKTIDVENGKTYSYILTGERIPNKNNCTYVIKYNNEAITLNSLGENVSTGSSFAVGDNIQIVSHKNGILKFKYTEDETDWTGVLTVLKFVANSSGTTTISFEMEV